MDENNSGTFIRWPARYYCHASNYSFKLTFNHKFQQTTERHPLCQTILRESRNVPDHDRDGPLPRTTLQLVMRSVSFLISSECTSYSHQKISPSCSGSCFLN
ncbi:hypothetical protein CDAR_516951 [Caerostris darwini]|uniref:Uncharacterized protein n=1 Tax=Caerostris darwini TaxID=1538125 RepID=A0AAV4UDY7_9ARAC|nr:hypothetical protein CDAR_516951 [Caerostris darwini]